MKLPWGLERGKGKYVMVFTLSFLAPKVIINLITTMKVTRELYNEIKARLQEAPGYTQAEVAKMVKVSPSTVSNVSTSKNYKWYHQALREKFAQQMNKDYGEAIITIPISSVVNLPITERFSPDKLEKTMVQELFERSRVKTTIKGHLRDIMSLLKQI